MLLLLLLSRRSLTLLCGHVRTLHTHDAVVMCVCGVCVCDACVCDVCVCDVRVCDVCVIWLMMLLLLLLSHRPLILLDGHVHYTRIVANWQAQSVAQRRLVLLVHGVLRWHLPRHIHCRHARQ